MKKIVSIILVAVMLGSCLVGCGSNTAAEAPAAEAPAAQAPAAEAPAAEASGDDEQVTLSFFGTFLQYNDQFAELVKKFEEENPNIKVDVALEGETFYDTLKTRISMGEFPDIFMSDGRNVTKPYLEYIDDLKGTELEPYIADELKDAVTIDGIVAGVPLEQAPLGFAYKKEIFEKYNLEIPQTFSEFKKVCETLQANGITPVESDFMDTWLLGDIICQGFGSADDPVQVANDINEGKIKLADVPEQQEMMDFFEYLMSVSNDNAISVDYMTSYGNFATDDVAMMWTGVTAYELLLQFDPNFNLGLMGVPMSDKTPSKMMNEPYPLIHLCKNSAHKEEAIKFLKFMFDSEASDEFVMACGMAIPGWKTEASAGANNPLAMDSLEYIAEGRTAPYSFMLAPAGYESGSGEVMQDWILGNTDKATTLDNLDAKWHELLQN